MDLYGQTRSYLARDHALIEPGSFVTSPLPGWDKTQGITLISPRMGARFKQYLAMMESKSRGSLWALISIYSRLLDRIAESHYDVLTRRISLSTAEKTWIALRAAIGWT